jgi:PASTA domain
MAEDSEPRPADRVDGEPVVAGPAGVPQAPVDPWPAGPEETAVGGPPLADTAVGAPVAGEAAAGGAAKPASPRWSARAAVPASRDAEETGGPWVFDPGRGVLLPALIAVMILLLLGLLALGIWLILRSTQPNPAPTSTVSAGPTTSAPATTGPPTTPPTTAPTTAPQPVALEDYHGRPVDDVLKALTTLGLVPNRVDQPSADVGAGLVIGTDPAAGATVAPGSTVTVMVSTGAPTQPPTTPPTTSSPP